MAPTAAASSKVLEAQAGADGVSVNGTVLLLGGKPWQFTGVNAPQAATDYAINGGCGAAIDVSSFFGSLPPNSVVRVNFAQDETIDNSAGLNPLVVHRDWRALDGVVAAADQSTTHVRLIAYLGTQSGTCDGGLFKSDQWYKTGFMQAHSAPVGYGASEASTFTTTHLTGLSAGLQRDSGDPVRISGSALTSYWNYLQQVVSRYAGNPAILMWEPMNEPEASVCLPGYTGAGCYGHDTCPADATTTLVNWFNQVGAEVHSLDPGVPVGTGELTDEQCGWPGTGELRIDESSGVDVASYHDYGTSSVAMPNGLAAAISDAKQAGKPLIVGEVGVPNGEACPATSLPAQGTDMWAKLQAAKAAGAAGWLAWC